MLIFPKTSDDKVYYYSPTEFSVSPGLTSSVLALAGNNAYRNGVYDGAGSGSLPTQSWNMWIGGNTQNGTSVENQITAYIQACAVYTTTLTATQISNLTTAMNAL